MSELVILVVEDDREVRDALARDLRPFEATFRVEEAQDVDDARAVVDECVKAGDLIALVLCDHLMPGVLGVDFLVELADRDETAAARKVLVTGQAGLEDTVKAVNKADLDHYISKPWKAETLHRVVREQLSDYVIENCDDLLPFVAALDGARLLEAMKDKGDE